MFEVLMINSCSRDCFSTKNFNYICVILTLSKVTVRIFMYIIYFLKMHFLVYSPKYIQPTDENFILTVSFFSGY